MAKGGLLRGRAAAVRSLAALLLVASQACTWGVMKGEPGFSGRRELWEVPTGAVMLPVALVIDVPITVIVSVTLTALNPLNWLACAIHTEPMGVGFYFFPTTAVAATLLNPACNMDGSKPMPRVIGFAVGQAGDGDEDDEE